MRALTLLEESLKPGRPPLSEPFSGRRAERGAPALRTDSRSRRRARDRDVRR